MVRSTETASDAHDQKSLDSDLDRDEPADQPASEVAEVELSEEILRRGGFKPVKAWLPGAAKRPNRNAANCARYRNKDHDDGVEQLNVRVPAQHRELVVEVARRLRETEGAFDDVLATALGRAPSANDTDVIEFAKERELRYALEQEVVTAKKTCVQLDADLATERALREAADLELVHVKTSHAAVTAELAQERLARQANQKEAVDLKVAIVDLRAQVKLRNAQGTAWKNCWLEFWEQVSACPRWKRRVAFWLVTDLRRHCERIRDTRLKQTTIDASTTK